MTETYNFYKELRKKNFRTFIDVGASYGIIIKKFRKYYPHARVYAFEPIKEYCEMLESSFSNLKVFDLCLWNTKGIKKLYIKRDRRASSLIKPRDTENKRLQVICTAFVRTERFDRLKVNIIRPCFLKIDVERAEREVIEGFGNKLGLVDALQFEYHLGDTYNKVDLGVILDILGRYGFNQFIRKICEYDEKGKAKTCDILCFKN